LIGCLRKQPQRKRYEMIITVKNGTVEVATGDLEVYPVKPVSATFTPTDGNQTDCSGVIWNLRPNGSVGFDFAVTHEANGDFPCGRNGSTYVYRFTGHMNANGWSPSGQVNFPGAGIEGDDNDTWQAGASEDQSFEDESGDEPYAQSQAAG